MKLYFLRNYKKIIYFTVIENECQENLYFCRNIDDKCPAADLRNNNEEEEDDNNKN